MRPRAREAGGRVREGERAIEGGGQRAERRLVHTLEA